MGLVDLAHGGARAPARGEVTAGEELVPPATGPPSRLRVGCSYSEQCTFHQCFVLQCPGWKWGVKIINITRQSQSICLTALVTRWEVLDHTLAANTIWGQRIEGQYLAEKRDRGLHLTILHRRRDRCTELTQCSPRLLLCL